MRSRAAGRKQVFIWLADDDYARLAAVAGQSGQPVSVIARSMIVAILRDDAAAHDVMPDKCIDRETAE